MLVSLLALVLQTTPPVDDPASVAPTNDEVRIVRTLAMDPEDRRPIVGWWSGPGGMLQVDRDGRYRWWKTTDRFAAPEATGRWHRENHAVFWIESYAVPKTPRRRAALWLRGDEVMTDLEGVSKPLRWSRTAPVAPADALIGTWEGPGGTLVMDDRLAYRWTAPSSSSPASIGGQRGRWRMNGQGRLVVEPLLASQEPAILSIERTPKGTIESISTRFGPMRRVVEDESDDDSGTKPVEETVAEPDRT